MKKGSLIGNVAQDLGLDLKRLRSGRARIVTGENIQYTELKADKGILVVKERIDREQLCRDVTPCSFSFEVILENPMELHQITVEITDINDHSPTFKRDTIRFEISESANAGSRFPLTSAEDLDVGVNGLREYFLTENENFVVKQNSNADGKKYAEMVLQKPLDRETNPNLSLKLIAVDGGSPQRSESGVIHALRSFDYEQIKQLVFVVKAQDGGSPPLSSNVTVKILIQDQNDNPPQVLYPVQTGGSLVAEMVPRSADVGYLVSKVVAVDVDSGQNAWLSYKLQKATDRALFEVGSQNGEIRTIRQVTDKDAVKQRLTVIVEDNGQPSRSATVIVNVVVADSFPEVLSEFTDFTQDKEYNDNLTFYLVLALAVVSFLFITCLVVIISVKIYRWRQSRIMFHSNLPVIPYYPPRYSDTLGTGTLQHVYNYEVCRTTDSRKSDCKFGGAGSQNVLIMDPSSTGTMQRIQSEKSILDEPDSPLEEMKKGSVIGNVAQDLGLDLKRLRSGRARIVTGENIQYTELKTDKGILVVKERIDREQLCGDETPCSFSFEKPVDRELHPHLSLKLIAVDGGTPQRSVKAQDGGSPPLSSNVTVKILIQDQNDNPPQVLYPVQTGGSLVAEMVPRSADVGYLVTKVVAVDVDSGQNAWLSYKLQKATDRALFEVGLQNGEIRTIRQVTDKDAVKQRLTVIVEDNGQPSRSATVIVNVVVADSFPEVLSEFTDFTQDKEYNDNLTFYLVLALAVVSFLFITCLVVIISVKIYRWRQSRIMFHSNLPVIPYYPPRYSDTLGTGTLQHVYNYEVCRTTDSRKSDCKFGGAGSQNVLIMDPSSTGTMQRIQSEKSILDEPDSPLEVSSVAGQARYSVPEEQAEGSVVGNIVRDLGLDGARLISDGGEPHRSGTVRIHITVLDANDNAPVCSQPVYKAEVKENSPTGTVLTTVSATDADKGVNGEVTFSIAQFAREIKWFEFNVTARDAGSPPLSSVATVKILIQDQNDNPPQVLYPVQTGGSLVAEMVPRSADVGYLVTKVVAVDVDSGQNAWLSYKLQKATDRALFEVGLQNGEIRTIRQVTDKDAVKQRLTVIVEDNGQPSRSATVIVNVVVADSFPEVLSEFTDFTQDKEYNDNLTFYLVLALAVVSFLFITCLVVIISVKIYRWRQSRIMFHSNLPVIPYYPPRYSDTLGTGTLQHVYNYEVCRTTDSRKSDMKYMQPMSQSLVSVDGAGTDTPQLDQQLSSNQSQMSTLLSSVAGQARYSVPEEQAEGSFVGNIARDLGLDVARLLSGKARIITKGSRQYVDLNRDKGTLVIKERIDREELCRKTTPCSFSFELILENPIQLHRVTVEVIDVNDNSPSYPKDEIHLKIVESVTSGTRFSLVSADDPDVGINDIQKYMLKPSDNFKLEVQIQPDGEHVIEMVLQTPLDREKEETHNLVLIASDGGEPHRSGTVRIHITVLDANDNAPVCSQPVYKAEVKENSPTETVVTTVSATDADKGVNGTTIAVMNVDDEDSDGNGVVKCSINSDIPFKIESSLTGYYTIVTEDYLDRESIPEYNITITVSDQGSTPLTSSKNINVKVSDVNDSPPRFDQSEYSKTLPENNSPGFSVFTLSASDSDWGQNARVSYFLEEKEINGAAVTSLVSVNSENGVIHAVRSFDYEQIKWFEFNVTARDAGSPPLSSVATVKILIQDQNDNPPQVLYPVQTGGSLVAEMVPRSADVGYLVTKVVAVDVDSGQNAWLSYKLQKATDRALFEVGLQNGEIRTIRQVTDKDPVKQRLSVIVEDNGQPSRSATVIVNVVVADSFPEVLSEFTDFTQDKEYNDNLTFYLVLALAVVSFLFITCLVVIISVKIYRWRQSRIMFHSNLPVIPYYPPRYSDTLGTGTLQHVYNYEVCRTTDSRKSDCKFGGAGSQNVLIMDPSSTGTMQRIQSEKSILDEPDSPLEVS
ncbi:hypothetical protein JOQ06_023661 [Pogonophryne albipinna]|uniref:Cadherin domain-containing protein n=1 Tax=Pogonophryne albipinna TaxID=1090488 RepID=A0AAD6BKS9_9TELE|nr:hypothetical protein JOQ06_023661 [Pogonophryne albipinna]